MMSILPPERRRAGPPRLARRGVFVLPSLLTVGNLFCGYASIVYSMRGELGTAAPFIGIAFVLDVLDGRIARLTGSESAFGLQLDSLADMASFGLAPAVLCYHWGLSLLGRVGWAAGFIYATATAMRLARFNLQTPSQADKRYFVGLPSPAAASVPAATVFLFSTPLTSYPLALAAAAVMIVPAALMVSTIRFRSFKTIDLGWQRSYLPVFLFALFIALIFTEPQVTLVLLTYAYLSSAFVGLAVTKWRGRRASGAASTPKDA